MAQAKPFIGIILLPYIICFFAENGVWPSYPASMQPMVTEMTQLVLTQRDDQIRDYCRGKFSVHKNETIKSVIIRKLLNKFGTTTDPLQQNTTTPQPQVNVTASDISEPTPPPTQPTLPPDVETIPPQTEPPPTEPPPPPPTPAPTEAEPTEQTKANVDDKLDMQEGDSADEDKLTVESGPPNLFSYNTRKCGLARESC